MYTSSYVPSLRYHAKGAKGDVAVQACIGLTHAGECATALQKQRDYHVDQRCYYLDITLHRISMLNGTISSLQGHQWYNAGTAQPRVMRGTAAAASLSLYRAGTVQSRAIRRHRSRHIISAASDSEVGTVGVGAIGLGALANPIVLASDWTLITTGKGFPEGPYGTPSSSKSSPSHPQCC